ncbi:MAG: phosphatidylglycerol lysyltransferase domain-containing protein [Deferribacteraceae bacterium]|jgi:hypothetical protein|nr:phosphatidylglycerol lysyltransferase domain-containing protein [Deferribacteraceae bacterium]
MTLLSEEKLECSHRDEISRLIREMRPNISEYSFANLYLFRRQHDYRVLRRDGRLFLQGVTYDGAQYLMPFSHPADIGESLLAELMKDGLRLFPVDEKDLTVFPENRYRFEFNDNDSDYIYTRDKIALYPGRHLHKKRNLVKQYRTLYKYEDMRYSCERAEDARAALRQWLELSKEPVENTDFEVCAEAIDLCENLALSGMVYYADGRPTGFLLGEELNANTFVIHFAKGVTMFKGIYPHMYNSLAASLPEKYTVLNFEQDLGKDTLRYAKSAYIQDSMRKKYRVSLK